MSWSRCGSCGGAPGWSASRLREVELDRVAPGRQHAARRCRGPGVLDERLRERRAREQAAEPLGPRAIEAALAERGRVEIAGKVRVERGDRLAARPGRDHAPALLEQRARSIVRSAGPSPGSALMLCPSSIMPPRAIETRRSRARSQMPLRREQRGRVGSDLDASAPSIPPSMRRGGPSGRQSPAEGEDLLEPADLGDAGIGADAASRARARRARSPAGCAFGAACAAVGGATRQKRVISNTSGPRGGVRRTARERAMPRM